MFNRIKKALRRGYSKSDHNKEILLEELPLNLRSELSYRMFKDLANSIEFLNKRSKRFIASIGPHLKPHFTSKDEVIISKGDYANEIYFIKKGIVGVGIKELNNICFMTISEGYYFGEVNKIN